MDLSTLTSLAVRDLPPAHCLSAFHCWRTRWTGYWTCYHHGRHREEAPSRGPERTVSPWMQSVIAGLRAVLVMSHLCLRAQMYECGPAVGKGERGGVEEGKEGVNGGEKGKKEEGEGGRRGRGRKGERRGIYVTRMCHRFRIAGKHLLIWYTWIFPLSFLKPLLRRFLLLLFL